MRFIADGILALALAVGAGLYSPLASGEETEGKSTGVGLSTDVSSKTGEVKIIRGSKRTYELETRTYKLKHADPYTIAQILREALATAGPKGPHSRYSRRRHHRRNPVVVTPLKYEDGTGAVIVTAPKSVFTAQDSDKDTGLDNIIRQIDKAGTRRVKDSIIHYKPKYRSAAQLAKVVENLFRKEHVIVSIDPKGNDLLIAGPPSAIKNAAKQLEKLDIPPQNYLINYRVLMVRLHKSMRNAAKVDGNVMWIGTDFKCDLSSFETMLKEKKAVKMMSGSLVVSRKKPMLLNTDYVENGDASFSPGCSMKVLITRPSPEVIEFSLNSSVLGETKGPLKNDQSHIAVRLVVDEGETRAVIGGGVLSASDSTGVWLRRTFGVSDFNSDAKFQMVLIVSCRKETFRK